jgi:hypothetical protein
MELNMFPPSLLQAVARVSDPIEALVLRYRAVPAARRIPYRSLTSMRHLAETH